MTPMTTPCPFARRTRDTRNAWEELIVADTWIKALVEFRRKLGPHHPDRRKLDARINRKRGERKTLLFLFQTAVAYRERGMTPCEN